MDAKTSRRIKLGLFAALAVGALSVPLLVVGQSTPHDLRPLIAAQFPDVHWIEPQALERWLADPDRSVHLLDARTEAEFAVSHLRGATRIDPDAPDLSSVPAEGAVVVYCSVGWRSGDIAAQLGRAGRQRVCNLDGGLFRWANEGRPVYRGSRAVREVHPYDETWGRMLDAPLRAYSPR